MLMELIKSRSCVNACGNEVLLLSSLELQIPSLLARIFRYRLLILEDDETISDKRLSDS